jgi:hypothetical protein
MFAKTIPHWRSVSQPHIPLKPEKAAPNDAKPQLFEAGVSYILTSTHTIDQLINEVLGFSDTKCHAFYELTAASKPFFLTSSFTRSLTYLIGLCYIKSQDLNNFTLSRQLEPAEVSQWLQNINKAKVEFKLATSYIREITVFNAGISFTGLRYHNCFFLKLSSFTKHRNSTKPCYTTQLDKLQLAEVYSNHDGKCQGAVRYWLKQIAIANQLVGLARQKFKQQYITSLCTKDKQLVDLTTTLKINTYQKGNYWPNTPLIHVQDLISDNTSIPKLLINLIKLIKLNALNNLYAEIKTIWHAVGIAMTSKGEYLKLSFYDPNSSSLYWKIYIPQHNIHENSFLDCGEHMLNLHGNPREKLQLYTRCYTTTKPLAKFSYIKRLIKPILAEQKNQLLQLSVLSNNIDIAAYALGLVGKEVTNLDNSCLIIAAIANGSHEMVNLLAQHGVKINFIDEKTSLTPLQLAIIHDDPTMVQLLLKLGARVDKFSHLLADSAKDIIISNLLKSHTVGDQ